jgi:hypothetical protein
MAAFRRFSIWSLPIVLGAGFLSCVGTQVVPAQARLVAPYVCPGDSTAAEVVTWTHGTSKGGRASEWDVICVRPDGTGSLPGDFMVMSALFALYVAIGLLVVGFYTGLDLVRRPKEPR